MAEFIKPPVDEINTNLEFKPNQSDVVVEPNIPKQSRVNGLIAMFNSKSSAKRKKTIKQKKTDEKQNIENAEEKGVNRHKNRSQNFKRLFHLGRSNAIEVNEPEVKKLKSIKQATLDGLVPMRIRDSTAAPSEEILENTEVAPSTLDGNKELSPRDDVVIPAVPDDFNVSAVPDDVMIPANEDPNNSQHELIQQLSQKINKLTEVNKSLSQENMSLSSKLEKTKNELAQVRKFSSQYQPTIDETEEDRDMVTSLRRISQSFDDCHSTTKTLDESTPTRKLQKAHSEL